MSNFYLFVYIVDLMHDQIWFQGNKSKSLDLFWWKDEISGLLGLGGGMCSDADVVIPAWGSHVGDLSRAQNINGVSLRTEPAGKRALSLLPLIVSTQTQGQKRQTLFRKRRATFWMIIVFYDVTFYSSSVWVCKCQVYALCLPWMFPERPRTWDHSVDEKLTVVWTQTCRGKEARQSRLLKTYMLFWLLWWLEEVMSETWRSLRERRKLMWSEEHVNEWRKLRVFLADITLDALYVVGEKTFLL